MIGALLTFFAVGLMTLIVTLGGGADWMGAS